MSDKILVLLKGPGSDIRGISIKKDGSRRNIKTNSGRQEKADINTVEKAFEHASSFSKKVVVLQILGSNLYFYVNDIILVGPAKERFRSYINEQILGRARDREKELQTEADKRGIPLQLGIVDSDDSESIVLEEASKGYDAIFLTGERRIFPLFKKTLAQYLLKNGCKNVIQC